MKTSLPELLALITIIVALLLVSCSDEGDDIDRDDDPPSSDDSGAAGDAAVADGDDDSGEEEGLQQEKLEAMFEKMGFLPYLEFEPVRTVETTFGYTRYFFSTDDIKCYDGSEANVAVSWGTSKNVVFYTEGGGAAWPGFTHIGFEIDFPRYDLFLSPETINPAHDWNIVYVPYCDNSLHAGDSSYQEGRKTVYHHGLRHTAAAAALAKKLFPDPEKILLTGISAGGFGTIVSWPIIKSQYMDADTYVFNDSGIGFWNPDTPETFELIKESWNLRLPDDCTKCKDSVVQSWLFGVYMDYDPQVRVGMFSSYRDVIMSSWFMRMEAEAYEETLLDVTGQMKAQYPDSYARYLIQGNTHTAALLKQGLYYEVDGLSVYEWADRMINESPNWDCVLE
jgi:Pectinacetylesterase